MFTLCNAGGFKPGCHATAAASASTTSARPLIAAWPTGASPYSPRHSVAAFQDQGPTPPAPLDLSWAQRVKTGDPATWYPSASSNLDADLDQDFLRSDDADLGWDTVTDAEEPFFSSSKGGGASRKGCVRRHGKKGGMGKRGEKARPQS